MDDTDPELLAELDLGGAPRGRPDTLERPRLSGRAGTESHCVYTRDLERADIAALETMPRGDQVRPLVRIHASHHSLARCLASGMKPSQAGLVTGYTPSRISTLQRDPAFSALCAEYRSEAKSIFADLAERMNDLSLDAIELLQERLHDAPEGFTIPVLLDLVRTFADRTGHGPNSEISLKVSTDLIDRPPRETYEQWQARREQELEQGPSETDSVKKLN
jgi:hypothetical protein